MYLYFKVKGFFYRSKEKSVEHVSDCALYIFLLVEIESYCSMLDIRKDFVSHKTWFQCICTAKQRALFYRTKINL